MGIFSTRYKVTVDVVSSTVIDETYKTDFTKTAILQAALDENTTVSSALSHSLHKGLSFQANQYLQKAKDISSLVSPTEITNLIGIPYESVREALIDMLDQDVVVIDAYNTEADPDILAREYVINNLEGTDTGTTLTFKHPSEDTSVTFTEGVFDEAELVIKYVDTNSTEYEIRVNYDYFDFSKDYLHVKYSVVNESNIRYWVYNPDTAMLHFPNLEKVTIENFSDNYYPILIIRNNFNDLNDTITDEERGKLNRALSKIGMDFDTLHNEILTVKDGNDPSQMEDVFLMFGCDVLSDDFHDKRYVYKFFENAYFRQTYTKADYDAWAATTQSKKQELKRNILSFSEDNSFKTSIVFNYIERKTINGVLPTGNKVEVELDIEPSHTIFKVVLLDTSKIYLRLQINPTQYVEYCVHGLHQSHEVYDNPKNDKTKGLTINLEDAQAFKDNNENKGIYLPVARTTLYQIPGTYRNYVLQNSLRVLIYASDVQKVRWYERSIFRVLVQIIIIAISIISQNYQGIGWALALEVVAQIVLHIIISKILVRMFELVVGVIGIENSAIVAAILTIAAITYGISLDEAAFSFIADSMEVVDALIEATSNVLQDEYKQALDKYLDMEKAFNEEMETLKDIQEELNTGLDISRIIADSNAINYIESPDEFFARTLLANPAEYSVSAVSRFVDSMLDLPRKVDTIALSENKGGDNA